MISNYSALYFTHNFIFFFIIFILILTFFLFFFSYFSTLNTFFSSGILLEFFWTVFPSVVVLLLLIPLIFDYSFTSSGELTYYLRASQWRWETTSPEDSSGELLNESFLLSLTYNFPLGSSVNFNLSAYDVLHSFGFNEYFVKIDCVPGVVHRLVLDFFYPGNFIVYCTELCGVQHSVMPMFINIF
uniref:Cytochrome c oxidase subunit 2 n=1 Tax=Vallicula multiformis TaxID=140489 RepID=A0A2R4ZJN5_9METZ|nr:cytochrome c oxidase subunit II [Vallicula multiformis]